MQRFAERSVSPLLDSKCLLRLLDALIDLFLIDLHLLDAFIDVLSSTFVSSMLSSTFFSSTFISSMLSSTFFSSTFVSSMLSSTFFLLSFVIYRLNRLYLLVSFQLLVISISLSLHTRLQRRLDRTSQCVLRLRFLHLFLRRASYVSCPTFCIRKLSVQHFSPILSLFDPNRFITG
jgi:hypothetical protein